VSEFTDIADQVEWPDHQAEQAARTAATGMGALDQLVEWLCGVQSDAVPHPIERARLVVVAADHGIAAAGVSAQLDDATVRAADELRAGRGRLAALAALTEVGVRVVDVATSGRIDIEDALSPAELDAAVQIGISVADQEIDSGADLLVVGAIGVGATTAASTMVSALTNTEPIKTVGRGSGIDDAAWMRKATAIRDARRRGWPHRNTPLELLRVVGGTDLAVLSALVLQAAARRTPVLIDGLVVTAAAAITSAVQPRAARWWRAAQLTSEPAHQLALTRLGLEPVLELGLTHGDGTGGLLVLPLLRAAISARMTIDADGRSPHV
jgi:nicotinate-nucleotide--dimethylbenzimidazole phosphoribosyltransferase